MKRVYYIILLFLITQATFAQTAASYGTATGSGSPAGWTESADLTNSGTYVEMLQSTSSLVTPALSLVAGTCDPTWLYIDARTFGGVSGTSANIIVDISTNNGASYTLGVYTITPSSTSLITYGGYDISGYNGTQVKIRFRTPGATGTKGVGIANIIIDEYCTNATTIGPEAMSVYDALTGAGFDANCNLTAYNQFYTMGSNSTATPVAAGAATDQPMWASFDIPAGCTATITAEYGYPYRDLGVCPDSRMDAGDMVGIAIGGVTSAQITAGTITNVGTCAYNAAYSGGTGTNGVVAAGCTGSNNTDQAVSYVTTGPVFISVYGRADRSDEIIYYSATVSSAACKTTIVVVVLPIELISFEAHKMPKDILLKWSTASESNNDYFMVEYSLDGTHFIPYKEVKGAGTSESRKDYNCVFTENVGNNTPYFRLKQVDYNGKYTYSPIIMLGTSLGFPVSSQSNVSAYYHSEKDKIVTHFHLESPQRVSMGLYDVTGAKIHETDFLPYNEGDNEVFLATPNQSGIYLLVYQTENGLIIHRKIVVTK